MTSPKDKPLKEGEEMSPYTEKKSEEAVEEHKLGSEGYKSPYVTEEPEPDKSSIEVESPYTEPDAQKSKQVPDEDLSPYTKADTPASSSS